MTISVMAAEDIVISFKKIYIYLFGCTEPWLLHVGSSSLTNDQISASLQ